MVWAFLSSKPLLHVLVASMEIPLSDNERTLISDERVMRVGTK